MHTFPAIQCPFDGTELREGFEWIFGPYARAHEKLAGECVGIDFLNGVPVGVYDKYGAFVAAPTARRTIAALRQTTERGLHLYKNGVQWGELVGPMVACNPHQLDVHIWVPFEQTPRYYGWHKIRNYPEAREFCAGLRSLFSPTGPCAGVILYGRRDERASLQFPVDKSSKCGIIDPAAPKTGPNERLTAQM